MNLDAERGRLQASLAKLRSEETRQNFLADFEALAVEHAAATDKAPAEAKIVQLQRHAAYAAQVPSSWSWFSIILISAVTAAFFLSLWAYFGYLGPDRYASISTTRPVLVLTLIICMLGFGGLLIVRSLFTTEPAEAFERRFRLAREVFLVFAGIFGTIIGFYFGAADDQSAGDPPAIEVAYANGAVSATVTGGAKPFLGVITPKEGGAGQPMETKDRILSYKAATCPAEARILVVDGRGRRTEGSVDCGGGKKEAVGDEAATGNAANGNTSNGV